jgi:hypothetical protein
MTMKHVSAVALASLLAIPGIAAAEDKKMGCDDVNWGAEVTEAFPQVQQACQGVTMKNDKPYAHFKAKVYDAKKDEVTVDFLDRDGKGVSRVKFAPPADASVLVRSGTAPDGIKVEYSKLQKGSVIDFYIPHDHWGLYGTPDGSEMKVISREAL